MKSLSNCIVCQAPLSGKQRSFCSVNCKNDYYLGYEALKKRAIERKQQLINAFGGGCSRCGYFTSIEALSFYDKNGETLNVNTNVLANSNFERLEKKLTGAQVLCRNCYEEISSPNLSSRATPRDLDFSTSVEMTEKAVGMTRINAEILKKFEENLIHSGVKPGQTIVLGVSGGVDSIAMFDLFTKSNINLNIIVAHINHGIREEAVHDERLVAELSKNHKLRFVSKTIQKPKTGNLEEELRNERRKFLIKNAKDNGASFIALAHNANDQAETFILNAVRGSGPAGLGAMKMSDNLIIRPLLNFSRAEIEAYARQNNLKWHEDKTNIDTTFSRNYVRHRILPLLERLNPEYLSNLHRTTQLQRQIDEHLKEEAWRIIQNGTVIPAKAGIQKERLDSWLATRNDNGVSVERLRRLDKPLLYEVLGILFETARGSRKDFSLAHLSAIENLIENEKGTKTFDLPGDFVARRTYDSLDFYSKKEHNSHSVPSTKKLKIGTQKFGDWKISVSECHPYESKDLLPQERKRSLGLRPGMTTKGTTNDTLVIDADLLPYLIVRTKIAGDRIEKIGMDGRKKLQDLFVDAKIDRAHRTLWPIILNEKTSKIIWIPGLAKAKQNNKSKKLLVIKLTR